MKTPRFYDTIGLSAAELTRAEMQAGTQEELIYALFEGRPNDLLTPEDALAALSPGTPLTSARRAMTNLVRRGLLEKTSRQRRGSYGRRIHYWSLATGAPQQQGVI